MLPRLMLSASKTVHTTAEEGGIQPPVKSLLEFPGFSPCARRFSAELKVEERPFRAVKMLFS
jgi:hypothetical protein